MRGAGTKSIKSSVTFQMKTKSGSIGEVICIFVFQGGFGMLVNEPHYACVKVTKDIV